MDPAAQILAGELGEELRPFLSAVITHLSLSASGEEQPALIAARVTSALDVEGSDDDAAAALLGSPEILASFFQNADLLPASGIVSERIVRVVSLALERAWEEN